MDENLPIKLLKRLERIFIERCYDKDMNKKFTNYPKVSTISIK